MTNWLQVCAVSEMDNESVRRFDHGDKTFAIYRNDKGAFYGTDGLCTHEAVHLEDGLVDGNIIECPKHSGLFDITNGEAVGPPACVDLKTYPVKVENDMVMIDIDG